MNKRRNKYESSKSFGGIPSGKIMTRGTVCVHGKSLFVARHRVWNVLTPVPFGDHQSSDNKRKICKEWRLENLNRGTFFLVKFLELIGSSMSKCFVLTTFPNYFSCSLFPLNLFRWQGKSCWPLFT